RQPEGDLFRRDGVLFQPGALRIAAGDQIPEPVLRRCAGDTRSRYRRGEDAAGLLGAGLAADRGDAHRTSRAARRRGGGASATLAHCMIIRALVLAVLAAPLGCASQERETRSMQDLMEARRIADLARANELLQLSN